MSTHATGTFEIDNWDEKSYDVRGGATLARAHLKKSFRGDVEGESTTELLLTYTQEGSVAYAGFERFVGSIHGRSGGLVLRHSNSGNREIAKQVVALSVVRSSGTGELRGLRGMAKRRRRPRRRTHLHPRLPLRVMNEGT
jgi:uncharacterized protein DUF3224